jgi:hypothetical protein
LIRINYHDDLSTAEQGGPSQMRRTGQQGAESFDGNLAPTVYLRNGERHRTETGGENNDVGWLFGLRETDRRRKR